MPSADAILLVSSLCTQLESPDPLVRARAATELASLIQRYENEGGTSLARYLACIGTPEAIEPLFESLHDAGPKERATLLDAIAASDRVPTGWLLSQGTSETRPRCRRSRRW